MAKSNKDRWPELCDRVIADDGLPVRTVGSWTANKLFYWNRYIEITTSAMVGSPKWAGGVVYVDLFGGPGVCELKETGQRVPGSALLAAYAPKPFSKILVCEKDAATADTCEKRLIAAGCSSSTRVLVGDCNALIDEVAAEIPERSLTLAFVDPEGLHIHFETLRKLTTNRRVDLLVLFADRMDLHRNVELYAKQAESNLDRFLGPESDWRAQWQQLPSHDSTRVCNLFADIYRGQFKRLLGYGVFDGQVMRSATSVLYRVIYASKDPKGAEFWQKISRIDRGGQKSFLD
jgi:three-Cys-motif partner protein